MRRQALNDARIMAVSQSYPTGRNPKKTLSKRQPRDIREVPDIIVPDDYWRA